VVEILIHVLERDTLLLGEVPLKVGRDGQDRFPLGVPGPAAMLNLFDSATYSILDGARLTHAGQTCQLTHQPVGALVLDVETHLPSLPRQSLRLPSKQTRRPCPHRCNTMPKS